MQSYLLADARKIGTHKQVLALGASLGCDKIIPVDWKFAGRFIPYAAKCPKVFLNGPFDIERNSLVIAGGRAATAFAIWLKRKYNARIVSLMAPWGDRTNDFDLCIIPKHDNLQGRNIITTLGSLHNITFEKLQQSLEHTKNWQLPEISIGFLLGGDSKHFSYNKKMLIQIAQQLENLVARNTPWYQGKLILVPSRRTSPFMLDFLQEKLRNYLWQPPQLNYLAILACSNALVVTGDSVSMLSEACFTGKPVYMLPSPIPKVQKLQQELYEKHHARFIEQPQLWPVVQLDELGRILQHELFAYKAPIPEITLNSHI